MRMAGLKVALEKTIVRTTSRRHAVLGALVTAGVMAMIAGASGQQSAPAGQDAPAGRGNFANNFTGKVVVGDTKEMRMSRIRFEAGARTNWHLHATGQLLLVEEGAGRLQELGSPVVEIKAGVPVYTKANVKHWHGAAPKEAALQFSVYSGQLDWLEPVSDADYLGPAR
jgi:quercetin dioxygenase-like cupin family protein